MGLSNARTGIAFFVMGLLVGFLTAPFRGAEVRGALGKGVTSVSDFVLVGTRLRCAPIREENAEDLLV